MIIKENGVTKRERNETCMDGALLPRSWHTSACMAPHALVGKTLATLIHCRSQVYFQESSHLFFISSRPQTMWSCTADRKYGNLVRKSEAYVQIESQTLRITAGSVVVRP